MLQVQGTDSLGAGTWRGARVQGEAQDVDRVMGLHHNGRERWCDTALPHRATALILLAFVPSTPLRASYAQQGAAGPCTPKQGVG